MASGWRPERDDETSQEDDLLAPLVAQLPPEPAGLRVESPQLIVNSVSAGIAFCAWAPGVASAAPRVTTAGTVLRTVSVPLST